MGIFDTTPATQTSTAPSWQTPYQNYGLNQALAQYQNTHQLVAPFAPQQEQAITNITNLAKAGDPGTNATSNFITNTLNGNVAQNPQLNAQNNQNTKQNQNQHTKQKTRTKHKNDQSQ